MKRKTIFILSAIILCLSLVACGENHGIKETQTQAVHYNGNDISFYGLNIELTNEQKQSVKTKDNYMYVYPDQQNMIMVQYIENAEISSIDNNNKYNYMNNLIDSIGLEEVIDQTSTVINGYYYTYISGIKSLDGKKGTLTCRGKGNITTGEMFIISLFNASSDDDATMLFDFMSCAIWNDTPYKDGFIFPRDYIKKTNTPESSTTQATTQKSTEKSTLASTDKTKYNLDDFNYNDLARNPEKHKMKKIAFTGKIVQVISENQKGENGYVCNSYRVAIDSDYDKIMYVEYQITKDNPLESRLLENDIVTFYGIFVDLYTYTSTLGANITVPAAICCVAEIN